jgi:Flp pilus assembly protein TadG
MFVARLKAAAARIGQCPRQLLRRSARDERGTAAVEFAFVAPIMVSLLVGTWELSCAITCDRHVTQIASSVADLVARNQTVDSSTLGAIMGIAEVLIRPDDPKNLSITVLSVTSSATDATKTTVDWVYQYNSGAEPLVQAAASYTLPTGILGTLSSVVVVHAHYNYTSPIFQTFVKGTVGLDQVFYLKPRQSSKVACSNC